MATYKEFEIIVNGKSVKFGIGKFTKEEVKERKRNWGTSSVRIEKYNPDEWKDVASKNC